MTTEVRKDAAKVITFIAGISAVGALSGAMSAGINQEPMIETQENRYDSDNPVTFTVPCELLQQQEAVMQRNIQNRTDSTECGAAIGAGASVIGIAMTRVAKKFQSWMAEDLPNLL